jgi:hypothetical protein
MVATVRTSWTLVPFVAFGAFIAVAYNLELAGGRFHSDLWFAVAWGGFPALTAVWANALRPTAAGLLAAGACVALSLAQRALSTPARDLRRRGRAVVGTIERADGTRAPLERGALLDAPERALRAMSVGMPLLAGALVARRL